jgi:hypothetical protein
MVAVVASVGMVPVLPSQPLQKNDSDCPVAIGSAVSPASAPVNDEASAMTLLFGKAGISSWK